MLGAIPCKVIHLDSAVEREPFLQQLQTSLGRKLEWVSASTGAAWAADLAIPKKHPYEARDVRIGELGCCQSHYDILQAAYRNDKYVVAIFEDDCELLVSAREVDEFITGVPDDWDILLLGANEYVSSQPIQKGFARVRRFWGTHAMILRGRAMKAVFDAFESALNRGVFLPADWLYNAAIEEAGLVVYGPVGPKSLVRQRPGVVSSITGRVRPA